MLQKINPWLERFGRQKYNNIQIKFYFLSHISIFNTECQISRSCRKTYVSKLLGLFSNNEIRKKAAVLTKMIL